MTTKTRVDLINEAFDQLGMLVPGQAVSGANMAKMDGIVDPVLEQMSALGIYYVADAGEPGPANGAIQSEAFMAVAAYLANAAAPKFNLHADAKLKALAIEAEDILRTLGRPATDGKLKIDRAIPNGRYWYNWQTDRW